MKEMYVRIQKRSALSCIQNSRLLRMQQSGFRQLNPACALRALTISSSRRRAAAALSFNLILYRVLHLDLPHLLASLKPKFCEEKASYHDKNTMKTKFNKKVSQHVITLSLLSLSLSPAAPHCH